MLARLTYVGGGRAVVCAQMASASSWGKGKKAPDFNEYLREQNGGRLPGDKRAFVDLVERIMMTDNPWEKTMFPSANSGKVRLRPDRARWNNVPIAITSWSLEESVINCGDAAQVQEWGIDDTKLGAVRYFAVLLYDLPTTQASLLADCGGLHLLSSAAAAGAAAEHLLRVHLPCHELTRRSCITLAQLPQFDKVVGGRKEFDLAPANDDGRREEGRRRGGRRE